MPATLRSPLASLALCLIGACAPPAGSSAPDAGSPRAAPPSPSESPDKKSDSDQGGTKPQAPEGPPEHARGGGDGCGLAIDDIALYQGVKTLLVHDGVEVRHHSVDVVQRRQALVRVFFKTSASFTATQVQASLILSGRDGKKVLVDQRKIAGASTDADLESTLNFEVPADQIGTDTSFAVELASPAACASLRFPEDRTASLGARRVGTLRIKLVPIRFAADGSDRLPDTSPEQLARLRDRVQAMYPVESVELSVREPVRTQIPVSGAPETWDSLLDSIRDLRAADGPDSDVYYFGLIAPAKDLAGYCPASCYMGLSFRTDKAAAKYQAGVGLGFTDIAPTVLAHELGHMAGRKHAPCKVSSFLDPQYPQPDGKTGTWGWDMSSHTLYAPETTDLMGYCSPSWISDYTYRAILDRMVDVDSSGKKASALGFAPANRVLLVGGERAHWGLDSVDGDEGVTETATVRDEGGAIVATVEVRRLEVGEGDRWTVLVPQPQAGWASIEVAGAAPVRFDQPSAGAPLER